MSWPPPYVFGALACVGMIGGGQLLFKMAADQIKPGFAITSYGLVILALALAVYGAATIAWVLVLRQAPLSKVYPYMALAFVIVPLASKVFLGESLAPQYWAGVALLFAGLVLISRGAPGV
jgi:drug/metabolite transporter (DMT)-like permease